MTGKRQHYVPRFLLRRFSIDPGDKKRLIHRLDKKTGRPQRVNIANEVVVGHYYRINHEDGTVDDTADEVLDRIESLAAAVVAKLADPAYAVTGDDVESLLLFIVSLKNRTPQGREALREMDERAGEMNLEMSLSDREHYHRTMRRDGRTEEEVEAERLEMLDDLKAGKLFVKSTPDREVALMFLALESTTKTVFEQLACICIRAPADGKSVFIVSDHPVSHYDPTPKMPEAGASFMSSPKSMTLMPLDPRFALLLVQDEPPQTWVNSEATSDDVDECNLLTYAWARDTIYGPTQEAVTRTHRLAKKSPKLMRAFAYRPPRVWIADVPGGASQSGPQSFTSRYKGQTVTRALHITQEGVDAMRQDANQSNDPPDMA